MPQLILASRDPELAGALAGTWRLQVVSGVSRLVDALPASGGHRPCLLVADAERSDFDLLLALRAQSPHLWLLLRTAVTGPPLLDMLLKSGARGCLPGHAQAPDVRRAVEAVLRGQLWLPRAVLSDLFESVSRAAQTIEYVRLSTSATPPPLPTPSAAEEDRPGQPRPLTACEQSAFDLARLGWTNKEIARELHVSDNTIKKHLARAFDKLGVHRRRQIYPSSGR